MPTPSGQMPARLAVIRDALLSVTPYVWHGFTHKSKFPYVIWEEEGGGETLWNDNQIGEQVITGTIDLFTEEEYDLLFERIQEALSRAGVSFRWNSKQRERPQKPYIYHYEWVWEIG